MEQPYRPTYGYEANKARQLGQQSNKKLKHPGQGSRKQLIEVMTRA